jgi:histidinol-phosphate aminotransferase
MEKENICLDRNENQYGPAPKCFDVLKKRNFKKLSIYSQDYLKGIKSRLSARLANDIGISEKSVVLGYGAEDILKQVVHCYLRKGDKILIPTHSWWYYKKIADDMEGINIEYPINEGEDCFYYDTESMIKLANEHKPKIVLISSPNNPTGNWLEPDDLNKIMEHLSDAVVVLDEAYAMFHHTNTEYLKELTEKFPNMIIVRTFSKYYALAGIRIGYGIMGANLSQLATLSTRYLGYNRLSERIALAALDSPEYYEEMRHKMINDTELYFNELKKIPGFKPFKSHANFILVKMPKDIMKPLDSYLKERGIILKFMNEEVLNSHIRITIGTEEQNKIVINAIKAYFSEK